MQNHCLEYMSEYMSEDPSHQICQSKCQNTCQRHVTLNFAISDARLYEGVDVTIFARIYFKTQTSVRLHVRLHVRIYDRTSGTCLNICQSFCQNKIVRMFMLRWASREVEWFFSTLKYFKAILGIMIHWTNNMVSTCFKWSFFSYLG